MVSVISYFFNIISAETFLTRNQMPGTKIFDHVFFPERYKENCCIPAVVNNTELSKGKSEKEGTTKCPLFSKN